MGNPKINPSLPESKKVYLKRLIFGFLEFRFHLVAEFRRPAMKKSKRFQKSSCFREQTPRTPYVFSHFPHHFSTRRMCSYSHQQDQHYSHFFLAAFGHFNRFSDVRAAMSRVLKATQVLHFVHDHGSIQPQTHATSGFDPTWTQNTRSLHTYRQDTPEDQAMPTTNC